MAHNVESMMYAREKPWHGLGTKVEEAPDSAEALAAAGLNWRVRQEDIFNADGEPIPGYRANVRCSDDTVLGVVGERYRIVQNEDAFRFTDDLIGADVRYETAGSLRDGKQIWLLARMPSCKIAGDEIEPYLCFTNSHDGSCGVKVCMTPIRVVCNNTLNMALASAKRSWSLRHTENIRERMEEARNCLFKAEKYMEGLADFAERAANTAVRDDALKKIVDELFLIPEEAGERERKSAKLFEKG